jgi:hypothetical protein
MVSRAESLRDPLTVGARSGHRRLVGQFDYGNSNETWKLWAV